MENVSIFYFSGTGNTWWASMKLAEILSKTGVNAEAVSIESKSGRISNLLLKSRIIFLNYPIYGSDRPEIVKEFINRLPEGTADFGIICTQLAFSGDGAWMEHQLIESRGYRIKWAVHLKMPNNISIPNFPFSWTNNRKELDRRLAKAETRL